MRRDIIDFLKKLPADSVSVNISGRVSEEEDSQELAKLIYKVLKPQTGRIITCSAWQLLDELDRMTKNGKLTQYLNIPSLNNHTSVFGKSVVPEEK